MHPRCGYMFYSRPGFARYDPARDRRPSSLLAGAAKVTCSKPAAFSSRRIEAGKPSAARYRKQRAIGTYLNARESGPWWKAGIGCGKSSVSTGVRRYMRFRGLEPRWAAGHRRAPLVDSLAGLVREMRSAVL